MKNKEKRFLGCSIFKIANFIVLTVMFSTTVIRAQKQLDFSSSDDSPLAENQGITKVSTSSFFLELLNSSQTAAALHPVDEPGFDFTTGEWIPKRNNNGFYHLGDLNFRIRTKGDTGWTSYSSAERRALITALTPKSENILAAADLKNTFADGMPVEVTRFWEKEDDRLVLRFEIKNKNQVDVEIGSLGIPMVFNNILHDKHLDAVHTENVFFDPYIGMDAGYLQVVRLNGKGQVLLVVPHGKTPFEAYRPLIDDPMPKGTTFEGFHEWMVHSKAYAEQEWKGVDQWNKPTSAILKSGDTYTFGLEFILADNVQNIEQALVKHKRPVAVGVPGYVLPMDVNAKLFLKHATDIRSIEVEPQGALSVEINNKTENNWSVYQVKGMKWGRSRLTITYADDSKQTINYKVIKSESELVADNGRFLTNQQWFNKSDDPFGRAPSAVTYDYEKKEVVLQDSRVWIAGLSDEGGAGSWLNAIMKQLVQPNPKEISQLEDFVNNTLWGGIQFSEGERKYGVRKSLFYYEPDSMPKGTYSDDINYKTWAAWSKEDSESTGRSYNYPHVTAAYWVMYRLARNYKGLVTKNRWEWYLENAFHTSIAMMEQAPYYAQFGQMEGTIFLLLLEDLNREGWSDQAHQLEMYMKSRASHWSSLNYPFGSEMPWDSTGQEEVYMWSKYFGFDQKASVTLDAILAYMPTLPHWGYNGSARRYWDFLYGGKLSRIERQLHHYGSGLNAIPVLNAYKENPDDLYLLRVGYGGLLGAVSNITEDGFAPCAFHSFPSTLKIDAISGDYGPNFFGYAVNTATYILHHQEFGWLSFGGNLREENGFISVDITTSAKSRVYIAPIGLELSLYAGTFKNVSYNPLTKNIIVVLNEKTDFASEALLNLKVYGKSVDVVAYNLKKFKKNERGLYVIPLKGNDVSFELK